MPSVEMPVASGEKQANPNSRGFLRSTPNCHALQFRGFNVLNRVAFGPLGGTTTLTNAKWGKGQSQSNTPRRMQLVAKPTW